VSATAHTSIMEGTPMRSTKISMLGWFALLCTAVIISVGGAGPAFASDSASRGGVAISASAISPNYTYADCPSSYFCAYDASGHMCKWQGNSPNWYAECSWADTNHPKYVYNHGTSGAGVTIYRYTNYGSPIGSCIKKGQQATLAGNYFIGSHRWNC
jgi:hypothetical protein